MDREANERTRKATSLYVSSSGSRTRTPTRARFVEDGIYEPTKHPHGLEGCETSQSAMALEVRYYWLYWVYFGIMENKMETTLVYWG